MSHSKRQNNTEKSLFENPIWMDSKEAADYLRVSINSLRMKVWRNQVHAFKEGRRLLFRKSDLDRLIKPLMKGTFNVD